MNLTDTPPHGPGSSLPMASSPTESSTSDPSLKSSPATCVGLPNAIFSMEFPGGASPSNELESPTTQSAGLGRAPVKVSASPESNSEPKMTDTCGLTSSASSKPVARRSSSASRSPTQLVTDGWTAGEIGRAAASQALSDKIADRMKAMTESLPSLEFKQIWKRKTMPSGRSYWEHTARGRLISVKDSIGLLIDGVLAGWPTPNTPSGGPNAKSTATHTGGMDLDGAATLTGWTRPSARDYKDTPGMATTGVNPDGSTRERLDQLPRQAALAGASSTSLSAGTEKLDESRAKRPALSPKFGMWLMGFPLEWVTAGKKAMAGLSRRTGKRASRSSKARATQSCPNSPPCS